MIFLILLCLKLAQNVGILRPALLRGAVSTCSPERKEFGAVFVNKVLSGPVLSSFTSANEITCQYSCHYHSLCYQYNFHAESNRCELLDGRTSSVFKIQDKAGWIFKAQKCFSTVCLNGGTCLNLGVKCVCPCPWSGDACQRQAFEKVNVNPVCFRSIGDAYGEFTVPKKGKVIRVKLIHISGSLTNADRSGKWGYPLIRIVITNTARQVIIPPNNIARNAWNAYSLPGFDYNSPELVFDLCLNGFAVEFGQVLRVWEGDDLANNSESDNAGQSCTDVYFVYE